MSDVVGGLSPYPPGSPEEAQYLQGLIRAPVITPGKLAEGAIANLTPGATPDNNTWDAWLPGLATAAYGGLGKVVPMALNYLSNKVGYGLNIPSAPGAEKALQDYQGSQKNAADIVDMVRPAALKPQGPDEEKLGDIAESAGSMISPVPGEAIAMVPTKAGRFIAHAAIPTAEHPVSGPIAMGTVSGVLDEVADKTNPVNMAYDQLSQQNQQQPSASQGGAQTLPFSSSSTMPTTSQQATGTSDQPTFGLEGKTGTSYGDVALDALGAAAIGWLALKHGGKILDNPWLERLATNTVDAQTGNAVLDAIDNQTAMPRMSGEMNRPDIQLPGTTGVAPTTASGLGTRLRQALVNPTAVVDKFTSAIAPDASVAEHMAATNGNTVGGATLSRRIGNMMATGIDMVTGRQGPSLLDTVRDYGALNDGQKQVLDFGLWARDELDNRKMMVQKWLQDNPGMVGSLNDDMNRFNLYRTSSDDLRSAVNLMNNDPQLAQIAKDVNGLQGDLMDKMLQRGRITQADYDRIMSQRPNYMPSTDVNGKIMHTFGERDLTNWGGSEGTPTNAMDAIVQHYHAVNADMAMNDWQRNIINNGLKWQAADSSRPRIFTEKEMPVGVTDKKTGTMTVEQQRAEGQRERTITVYQGDGPHTYYVNNSTLWNALQGNQARTSFAINGMNTARRLYQQGTTGVSATLLAQNPFMLRNMTRGMLNMGVNRQPGTYGGLLDRAIQQKGYRGYRGFDPSNVPGVLNEAGRGAAAVTAKGLANMLREPANYLSQAVRAAKGDKWADAWAQRLEQRYADSRAAGRHEAGIGGGGSFGTAEAPTYQMTGSQARYVNPLAGQAASVFHGDLNIPGTNYRMPGTKGLVATYINTRDMLREIHAEISDSGNAYYYELNKNNPNLTRERLIYNTQNIQGDPSVMGTGAAAQWAGRSLPYLNATVQDIRRQVNNFRNAPVSASFGMMSTLAVGALASTLTAMLGGQSHVNHLENQMSTQQRAANMVFYHDPSDPNNHTMISLPQTWRWMYPMILEAVSTAVGAFDAHADEGTFERLTHAVSDFFSHHVTTSTYTSTLHGLGDALDVSVPPGVNAVLAPFGQSIRPSLSDAIIAAQQGQPIMQNWLQGETRAKTPPGQMASSTLLSNDDNKSIQGVLNAIVGAASAVYATAHGAYTRYEESRPGEGIWNALAGIGSDAGQNWRDNSPSGNIIWGNNAKLSALNPLEESVSNRLRVLDSMMPANQINAVGRASPDSVNTVIVNHEPMQFTDPTMKQMYFTAQQWKTGLEAYKKEANDIRAQIREATTSGYPAEQKRELINTMTGRLNDQYVKIDKSLQMLNARLSQMAGNRHVDIGQYIDWRGNTSQFHQ